MKGTDAKSFAKSLSDKKQLGRGGMGLVWLAEDHNLPGRWVALKENPELGTDGRDCTHDHKYADTDENSCANQRAVTLTNCDCTDGHCATDDDNVSRNCG